LLYLRSGLKERPGFFCFKGAAWGPDQAILLNIIHLL
jgi:hypothetical protein